jgi:hypothetical protein
MARKCYISFKTEDIAYKIAIQKNPNVDIIDKSLDIPINSDDEDYIMQKIRSDYLSDSTVTIHLIGAKSAENFGWNEQRFIKRELQASLYNGVNSPRSGILGVVLPSMYQAIYGSTGACSTCGQTISFLNISDSTATKEFHYNYHIPKGGCHWSEDDRYCVMVKWDDFISNPNLYIEQAFTKRTHSITNKVRVRPN